MIQNAKANSRNINKADHRKLISQNQTNPNPHALNKSRGEHHSGRKHPSLHQERNVMTLMHKGLPKFEEKDTSPAEKWARPKTPPAVPEMVSVSLNIQKDGLPHSQHLKIEQH